MFSPKAIKAKGKVKEETSLKDKEMATYNFYLGLDDDFDVIRNVVSMLPRDYDCVTKVTKLVDCDEEEIAKHKHVC